MPDVAVTKGWLPEALREVALGSSPRQCRSWADTQKCLLEDVTTGWWMVDGGWWMIDGGHLPGQTGDAKKHWSWGRACEWRQGLWNRKEGVSGEVLETWLRELENYFFAPGWWLESSPSSNRTWRPFLRWMNPHCLGGIKQQAWHKVESQVNGTPALNPLGISQKIKIIQPSELGRKEHSSQPQLPGSRSYS